MMKTIKRFIRDKDAATGSQWLATFAVVLMVGLGGLVTFAYLYQAPTDETWKEKTIHKSEATDRGMILEFKVKSKSTWDYSTADKWDYTATTLLKTEIYHRTSLHPPYEMVTWATYDSEVGNNETDHSNGGDVYWQDGHTWTSDSTSAGTEYAAYDLHTYGDAVDSVKCWWDVNYNTTATNTTAVVMAFEIWSNNAANGKRLWETKIAIPFHLKYEPTGDSSETQEDSMYCYLPFTEFKKENVYVRITGSEREKASTSESGWNGILWTQARSSVAASHYDFVLDLLWGAISFSMSQTKVSELTTINDGTDGDMQLQPLKEYKEQRYLYKVR